MHHCKTCVCVLGWIALRIAPLAYCQPRIAPLRYCRLGLPTTGCSSSSACAYYSTKLQEHLTWQVRSSGGLLALQRSPPNPCNSGNLRPHKQNKSSLLLKWSRSRQLQGSIKIQPNWVYSGIYTDTLWILINVQLQCLQSWCGVPFSDALSRWLDVSHLKLSREWSFYICAPLSAVVWHRGKCWKRYAECVFKCWFFAATSCCACSIGFGRAVE